MNYSPKSLIALITEAYSDRLILVDTNVVCQENHTPPLKKVLSTVYKSKSNFPQNFELTEYDQRLSEIWEIANKFPTVFIPEVVKELRTYQSKTNMLINYLLRERMRQNTSHYNKEIEQLKKTQSHCRQLGQFINSFENINPLERFSTIETERYNHIFDLVYNTRQEDVHLYTKKYNSEKLGEQLQTDAHLATATISSSYDFPVLLLTQDIGLLKLTTRVKEKINFRQTQAYYQIDSTPNYDSEIINPSRIEVHEPF